MTPENKRYTIGIDVGGTKMAGILFDGSKAIFDYSLGTPKDNLEHFMVMLVALIEPLADKAKELKVKVEGVGLGIAGVINPEENRMLKSPNIPIIDGIKVANLLEQRIGLPVKMENDAKCFIRAEMKNGAGKGFKNGYGIVIGTGIGGGWWMNDNVYLGPHGAAGEPGEMIVNFETGLGLEEAYHKMMKNNPAAIAQEAYRGDVLADKIYRELGKFLGYAFANIVNILDPEIFIIGGGVVDSSDLFLNEARKFMKENIESSEAAKKVKIVKSKLGKNAGAIGAAMLV